jgi:magnesium chelatase subunit D
VGQELLKEALILNAINPDLRGVLVRGERGTAKSTAVRALAELLPEIDVVEDCPFNCHPTEPMLQCDECNKRFENGEKLASHRHKTRVVELPLGATEDRIIGTIDIEKILKEGVRALQPGLLAAANRGFLYIDEINLLDDHLVDVLLDAAAMGVNVIEREGVSFSHPARFILIGSMNPQEGDLRPQILDRIGLQVDVVTIQPVEERMRIVEVVEKFERDPKAFMAQCAPEQHELRDRIVKARLSVRNVKAANDMLRLASEICINAGVEGHRADILITRCAKTIAAFDGRTDAKRDDVIEAAQLVLPHRIVTDVFEPPEPVTRKIEQAIQAAQEKEQQEEKNEEKEEDSEPHQRSRPPPMEEEQDRKEGGSTSRIREDVFPVGETKTPEFRIKRDRKLRTGHGRRVKTLACHSGRYVRFKNPAESPADIALDATIRAAVLRKGTPQPEKDDIRQKIRQKRRATSIVFTVDASGSMGAKRRMEFAKGACLALLKDAYQKRDKIGFVAFRGKDAKVLLPLSNSISLARQRLAQLPTGGKTPLAAGLLSAFRLLKQEMLKDRNAIPVVVLISDGCANVPLKGNDVKAEVFHLAEKIGNSGIHIFVLDASTGLLQVGLAREIARISGGSYQDIQQLLD